MAATRSALGLPRRLAAVGLLLLCLSPSLLRGQEYGARLGSLQRGGRPTYEPTGPGVLFDALDPVVRKWYVPQELYAEYGWLAPEYANYARDNYQRYVSTALEGSYIYDQYGNFLTHGWLLYDFRQESPQPFGSAVEKTSRFSSWFNSLVVAADHQGQYHYSVTVGSQIRTTLTPMTFSKPLFDGVQVDFASDKYQGTVLMSRASEPGALGSSLDSRTNATNLIGGRFVAQVGDFARVGGTLVTAYNLQTQLESMGGDVFRGQLTESQNYAPVTRVQVALTDDSPGDNADGAALFGSDIVITAIDGTVYRGSENGYAPQVEGGFQRPGYVAADGIQRMVVTYDFYDLAYTGPDPADVAQLQVELAVANDYRVEVSSDRQVNRSGDTYFLPVTRARGNPGDGTNLQVLSLDYGLPTANRIAGLTLELTDLGNVRGNLEIDLNRRYRQYPNPDVQRHHTASEGATAWHLDLSHTARPFFSYLEAFSVDPDYTTSVVTAGADGLLDYGNEYEIYEFVEDNDDQDRRPDWRRKGWGPGDDAIFPGWDENNDLISDYNQNDNEDSPNLVPDYEEPFLRFHCDPPEFAFGVDMNHNGTVDRFENDSEPDLPYPRDRRGYNLYGGAFLGPDVRLTLGRLRTREIASRRRAQAHYVLLTGLVEPSSRYRLRFYQDARLARDEIPDDLVQWVQERNVRGGLQAVTDPLPARDTWVNTTWLGLDHRPLASVALQHKLKWEIYRQRLGATRRELLDLRRTALLLGLVDKAEHTTQLRDWTVLSRWKSQYLRRRPVRASRLCSHDLSQFLMILGRRGLMRRSYLQAGVEYEVYRQLADPLPAGADDSYTGLTTTCQVGNVSQYMGYGITTLLGFELRRLDFAGAPTETRTRAFITMYAGVQQ